jgi:hypothetical protein
MFFWMRTLIACNHAIVKGKIMTQLKKWLPEFRDGQHLTLDDLWDDASSYGRVRLCTSESGKVWAVIEFETVPGITLKAQGEFVATPQLALLDAIKKAVVIKNSMGGTK